MRRWARPGAARLLLTGPAPETVALRTPKGIVVEVAPLFCRRTGAGRRMRHRKGRRRRCGRDHRPAGHRHGGAAARQRPAMRITGGAGVGRVTKPGLDQPVGDAAINHVPRQMITEALRREADSGLLHRRLCRDHLHPGRRGAVARRTFNPHIGVEGGLSVLGTSGIVEPMSQQAILDTIQLEMNQAALRASGPPAAHPGPRQLRAGLPARSLPAVCRHSGGQDVSNFHRRYAGYGSGGTFEEVLLVGHIGKLCKLAGGIMNTHSHTADCRTELFCTHAALCGADREAMHRAVQCRHHGCLSGNSGCCRAAGAGAAKPACRHPAAS